MMKDGCWGRVHKWFFSFYTFYHLLQILENLDVFPQKWPREKKKSLPNPNFAFSDSPELSRGAGLRTDWRDAPTGFIFAASLCLCFDHLENEAREEKLYEKRKDDEVRPLSGIFTETLSLETTESMKRQLTERNVANLLKDICRILYPPTSVYPQGKLTFNFLELWAAVGKQTTQICRIFVTQVKTNSS